MKNTIIMVLFSVVLIALAIRLEHVKSIQAEPEVLMCVDNPHYYNLMCNVEAK